MSIRKVCNALLALILIISITVVGGVTLVTHFKTLAYSALITYTYYLPEKPTVVDNVNARIKSFTEKTNTNLFMKKPLERFNVQLQLALGKQMLSFGGSTMVTTKTDHLYDLMSYVDTTYDVKLLAELSERLSAKGIPLIYGYAHTTLYDGEQLPDGITDDNNKIADEIVGGLRAAGITTLDSREIMRESNLTLNEMIYRTDAHWSARNAFEMYTKVVDVLNNETVIKADREAADINNFDVSYLKNAHISDLGNRIGAGIIQPDDFEIISPKFETNIHREIMKGKKLEPSDGTFDDVVLDKTMLPDAKGVPYTNCYNYYGQHPEVVYYTNESAPEGRLLVVKDSFGTPVSSFLSLAVREVCAIDLRKTRLTIEEFVDSFKPDAVVIVHCQEVMRGGQNFVIIDAE